MLKKVFKENNYDPVNDYIIPIGSKIINFLIGLLCSRAKILIWDPKTKTYVLKEVEFDQYQVRYFDRQTQ